VFRRRNRSGGAADDAVPSSDAPEPDAPRAAASGDESPDDVTSTGAQATDADVPVKSPRPDGPWDVEELDGSHPSHERARLDLGALRIRPEPGMQVQVQVDSGSGQASSVTVIGPDAAVQLIALSAARSVPLWPSLISAVAADATRRGGTATPGDGPWGPVLKVRLPATTSAGAAGVQPSVVMGVDGPRWMLRATLIGRAATDPEAMQRMLALVADTVVVRGEAPMPPGEIIPLRPPPVASAPPPPDAAREADAPVSPTGTSLGEQGGTSQGRPVIGG
jgi:hypothetical protein